MEKGTLLGADVDESGLDPRKHCVNAAEVDIAYHAAVVGAVHHQLNELVVLQHRHARFSRAGVDQYLTFHCLAPVPMHGGSACAGRLPASSKWRVRVLARPAVPE